MPQTSKYSSEQFEKTLNVINIALEAQNAPADLALMALGEAVIDKIAKSYSKSSQEKVIEQFCLVLKHSLK